MKNVVPMGAGVLAYLTMSAQAEMVTVTVTNLAPANGTYITPVWVGFHNGTFDIYDSGATASEALERVAEDGDTSFISGDFTASGAGLHQATLNQIGPIGPGASVSMSFDLDGSDSLNRYFSYLNMIIPSNDAFIANGNPLAFPIFDEFGEFIGADFTVLGSMVNDAGTEVNDELPMNTAFFGQMTPDTGVDENGVVHMHPGFLPPGSGGILDDPMFANADFTQPGYQIARITIVPEPSALAMVLGVAMIALRRRMN